MNCTLVSKITVAVAALVVVAGCNGPKREPGRTYMPDMAYSRAYESYPDLDTNVFTGNAAQAGNKIYYDRLPVAGTVKRGIVTVYHGTNDSVGIAYSKTVANPMPDTLMAGADKTESERLFNIYCAVCHGTKMDGQGPLVTSGKWAGIPANLMDLTKFGKAIYPDGQLFHTITYGKNTMGGYASQLKDKQRWMLVNYIRSKQATVKPAAAAPAAGTTAAAKPAAATDTAKKGK
ncbi:MAG: cytochrome c [Dinghuibacter sp.]|nr:cytochrome c [Dinghuibacter sp.]